MDEKPLTPLNTALLDASPLMEGYRKLKSLENKLPLKHRTLLRQIDNYYDSLRHKWTYSEAEILAELEGG